MMNDQETALAMGKLVIDFRNSLLKHLPLNSGVIEYEVRAMFEPAFDGVGIGFTVRAVIVDVKTGELSILEGEIEGHAEHAGER